LIFEFITITHTTNIMSNQCSGTTLKGIRCTVKTNSVYCRFHKNQDPSSVPLRVPKISVRKAPIKIPVVEELQQEICCVCTDPINTKLTPCGHSVHIDCVIKSGKQLCPLCRQKVRMTKEQRRQTGEYNEKYQRENRQEQMENIQGQMENRQEQMENFFRVLIDFLG
jgi:hypothetical protein